MRSLEHDYLLEQPISQGLLMQVRALGEYRGRQDLFRRQSPEVLETLKRVAMVQSVESSNRIEGVTVAADRLEPLVLKKTTPRNRSESEVAGYRDALAEIHANAGRMRFSSELILDLHRRIYARTEEKGGAWKEKDNAILEVRPDGQPAVRFRPVSYVAAPEFVEKLCKFYHRAVDERQVEPLLLIPAVVFDFECIHPFWDGNGRVGRLLTLLLLYQHGYEVGRYISLERLVEETKESYYETLLKSSQNWHEARHDLRPWWDYFLGTLIAAYKEFEDRVGAITTARGAKREIVEQTVQRLPSRFRFGELQRACPGISDPTLKRALFDLKRKGVVRCLGKGRDAEWERTGSASQ
ncbi:MAG: Fic family protein [Verrucomicrobia bacterium]|nr:Fic family protein [Verrucomicrobiota bacterium]